MRQPGDSFTHVVDMAGEYGFIRIAHVMWGTIVVKG